MNNLNLVKKFRPIFVFSKEEKYYPINKKFMKKNTVGKEDKYFSKDINQNLNYPQEPLYFHILDEDEDEVAVVYILIFPFTGITTCVMIIDKNTKTLKEIYFPDGEECEFKIKTTRPVIYVRPESHSLSCDVNDFKKGLRWEPGTVEDFKLRKLEGRKLEGKNFNDFLNRYS